MANRTVDESELIFRRLLEQLPAGAYTCDAQGLITYFNQAAVQLWGREPKLHDPIDRFCGSFKLFLADGTPIRHDQCWMALALQKNEEFNGQEIIIERPDGSRATALAHANPICDSSGKLLGAVNVLVDISERKRAEELQARLAAIVESSEDAIISKSLEGRILSWNSGAERIFGYTAQEAIGSPITMLIPPERLDEEQSILARLRRGERIEHYETVRITKEGRHINISLTVSPIWDGAGRIIGASKIVRDITARTQMEEARRESDQRFAEFMQHLPGLAWIKDLQGRYVFLNQAAERAFQKSQAEVYGKTDEEIFPPKTAAQFRENDSKALADERGVEAVETLEHADGPHHSIVSKFSIPGRDGTPTMIGGMAIDITKRMRFEAALRESEARFRNMADNAPVLIWVNNLDGCEFVNREYLRFTGCSTIEDVQGMQWTRFVHPDDVENYVGEYQKAFAQREPYEAECRLRRADGQYRWMRSAGVPRFAADESFLGYVGSTSDIDDARRAAKNLELVKDELAAQLTDLRRLHEMSVRLSTTLELQPTLNEILSTVTAIEGTDLGTLSLCDHERNQLTIGASFGFGKVALRAIQTMPPCNGACGTCIQEQRHVVVEDTEVDPLFAPFREIARRAGFRAMHSTPLLTRSGKTVGILSTYFRKPHRPSDRERRLIDVCARQAVDFIENARLYSQLREADQAKNQFLATLGHELRNPLAPICNALNLLRLSEDLSPSAQRVCNIMQRQVTYMVRLVDDLLEISRITRGKCELRKEPLDLVAVVGSAVETSRPAIDAARHQLAVALPSEQLMFDADPVRLTQIIANLLSNAAKYTPEGGQIWLTARREGSEAVICVKDTGMGIPADMLPHVFDMFAQVDHTLPCAEGGLGIGLTLARSLVELHGGRIEAHSDGTGTGSEFVVRLPLLLGASRLKSPHASPPKAISLPARRILVVDDSGDAVYIISKLLEKMGQYVRTVGSGAAALDQVRQERPDIVISDIAMPDMNGYELARRLRQELGMEGVVLVALTGYGQDSDRQRAKEAGFDHHLVKPVSLEALQHLLAFLCQAPMSSVSSVSI